MTFSTPVKLVLAFLIMGMTIGAFYALDWQEKYKKIDDLKAEHQRLEEDLVAKQELIKELPVLTKQKADLEAKLASVIKSNLVPEKAEMFVANYIMEIEKLTAEERERMGDPTFEIISITPGAMSQSAAKKTSSEENQEEDGEEAAKPDVLKQFPTRMFQMSMKGRYSTLVDFLYQLGAMRLERLVTINKIALSPAGNDEPGMVPTLSISIPITAYMREGS
ncbi:MAG: hypothetical protein Q4F00_05565 [bacterium]|nr:hypothetical protein [bacterium]